MKISQSVSRRALLLGCSWKQKASKIRTQSNGKIHPLFGWLHFLHVMLRVAAIRGGDVTQRSVHLVILQRPVDTAPLSSCLQGVVARSQGVEITTIVISQAQVGNTFEGKILLSGGLLTIASLAPTATVNFVHVHPGAALTPDWCLEHCQRGTRHTNSLGTLTTCGKSNVPISYFIAHERRETTAQGRTQHLSVSNQQLLLSFTQLDIQLDGLPFKTNYKHFKVIFRPAMANSNWKNEKLGILSWFLVSQ